MVAISATLPWQWPWRGPSAWSSPVTALRLVSWLTPPPHACAHHSTHTQIYTNTQGPQVLTYTHKVTIHHNTITWTQKKGEWKTRERKKGGREKQRMCAGEGCLFWCADESLNAALVRLSLLFSCRASPPQQTSTLHPSTHNHCSGNTSITNCCGEA